MNTNKEPASPPAEFGPLVITCAAWGINRSTAFALAKAGTLEVFRIGTKPYVMIDSLRQLPQRMANQGRQSKQATV